MKKNSSYEKEIISVSLADIQRFLLNHNWQKVEHLNKKVDLYKGPRDQVGNQLEIFLPRSSDYDDYQYRINDAIRLLSFVYEKDVKEITTEISQKDHDIFKVRLLKTGPDGTIPLSVAASELSALKNLFIFAACSEEDNLPFFERPLTVGINYANECQFGHTFQGSFGFTINSPINNEYNQPNFFDYEEERPFERRVMERIIRSLNLIEESVNREDHSILVDNFDIGLNARMCESLLEVSQYNDTEVIFNVSWSPKVRLPQDINVEKDSWHFNQRAFELIEYAAEELKQVEPYEETITGPIVTLHSSKNPMSDEMFNRIIIIKYELEGRTINVKLDLDRHGYSIALEAHKKGLPIKVVGKLFRKGNTWRMIDIEDISMLIV